MAAAKSNFLEKVLGRIGRLDKEGLQTVVERLARERTFLETLFNTIEDGVLVVDETGRILYFNEAASRMFGLQAAAAEGQHVSQILSALDWEKLLGADRRGGTRLTRYEFEIDYPRPRFLSLYAAPLDGEAIGSSGVALILHDATEARQRTNEAIESERIQALTLLAASVAHEIGNPLNALHIHLQLMEREIAKLRAAGAGGVFGGGARGGPEVLMARPATGAAGRRRSTVVSSSARPAGGPEAAPGEAGHERLGKYLEVCKGEITRLDYIVTQFLQAIRPSMPQLRHVSVNDIVREAVELLRPEIENRGIVIREKLARHISPSPLDPAQIKQVLVNLIKNAIQAMTRDGVLTVETAMASDGVVLSVGDTGCGIPPDQLKRIYEPFYTTKKKGSGLGLMIVQRIIREHRGYIKIESDVGRGTVFRVWLPLLEKPTRLLAARHD